MTPGQRVEVTRHLMGVTSQDLGTVVDFPDEERVRVRLFSGSEGVHDRAAVRSIPDAVRSHISALMVALGSVSDDERARVEEQLRRVRRDGLIDFARECNGEYVRTGQRA